MEQLVRKAKKERVNRAYYEKYFLISDIREAGLVQSEPLTQLDRVQLEENVNELIFLFGFDDQQPQPSQFQLQLSIVSLFPNGQGSAQSGASSGPPRESRWRLATLDFKLVLQEPGTDKATTYSYAKEQLLDYSARRAQAAKHEHRNVHKVGSLTLEQVLPFSLARIHFNGLMEVSRPDGTSAIEPMRLNISTHPTCDKFDYAYCFNRHHTASIVSRSLRGSELRPQQLLQLALENRFDQPLMFQGTLKSLAGTPGGEAGDEQRFIMWGAKVKRFLELDNKFLVVEDERDCLFVWTRFGLQLHLNRPSKRPQLIYGLVHNCFDYAGYLYEASLVKVEVGAEKEADFGELDSFSELTSSHKIKLRAFKKKNYVLEIGQNDFNPISELPVFRVKLNGFDGWALRTKLALGERFRAAQNKLLALNLHDPAYTFKLADERLLGGKGHSLVQLARLVGCKQLASATFGPSPRDCVKVSVPRGLVLSTRAMALWLESSPKIRTAVAELDATRRTLNAKSVYPNPMSKDYLPKSKAQRLMREKCEPTSELIRSVPLPGSLKAALISALNAIFDKDELDRETGKLFAVRSSALGEDSLETSAAGQMRTILDARGLAAICQAVVDCWASQFELEALTYKSQNGLPTLLPMAVVVQELVGCHAAGVAATCNPLTGNARRLEITANLGLGEGVVAGNKTDTIRVLLANAADPDDAGALARQRLRLPECAGQIERLPGSEGAECCLSEAQIVALANLLLELRAASAIGEREVEWGVTLEGGEDRPSSPVSSSSSDSLPTATSGPFRLHLLQSRPLTNLQRLTTREIDHELDYGLPCPNDIVSRANLGEVMPGSMCPLNSSYSMPLCTSYSNNRPFCKDHTRNKYVSDSFGFYGQIVMLIVTYTDTLRGFAILDERQLELAKVALYTMIGSTFEEPETEEARQLMLRFHREKLNPLGREKRHGLLDILIADNGGFVLFRRHVESLLNKTVLIDDLPSLDQLIKEMEEASAIQGTGEPQDDKPKPAPDDAELESQIRLLYKRLASKVRPFCMTWETHMHGTLLSMACNMACLRLLSLQPAYKDAESMASAEILNDFSVLLRGKRGSDEQSESGDVSKLLNLLLKCLLEENLLERAKAMKEQELYDFFTSDNAESANYKCCQLFRDFMKRNGHRAFREFCFSTITWSDDSSYIMRLLAMRLKNYTREQAERDELKQAEIEREQASKYAQVEAKISPGKLMLLKWAFSRARNATVRREGSKSLLIKATHKYRLAFRHLGGLLCLAGLLPDTNLIFYLTIEELNEIIESCCADVAAGDVALASRMAERQSGLMPRLLYKARRRQQRARTYDTVNFPRPNLTLSEMFQSIEEQTNPGSHHPPRANSSGDSAPTLPPEAEGRVQVSGLISCAGFVTGRACVISTLDETDQLQPGDILITYSIDISWTVYFFALSGIVTEVGGIVSHGAVVAREYGIPTLCTAIEACKKFKTGQMVTLDANRGLCYLAAEEAGQVAAEGKDGAGTSAGADGQANQADDN